MANDDEGRKEVAKILKDADICVLTTVNASGQLFSRPLALQEAEFDGDLWFVTQDPSPKADEIRGNPHVNVSVSGSDGYLSISGTARSSATRRKSTTCGVPRWNLPVRKRQGRPRRLR